MASFPNPRVTNVTLAIAVLALGLAGWVFVRDTPRARTTPSDPPIGAVSNSPLLSAVNKGTITVGYGGYPPYTVEDPATGAVTGLGPDIVNEIASQLGIKVVWRKFNWSTMLADMKRGEIDMLADPILQTVPRGREFAFSEPYVFLPSGVGIIRQGGKRLASFSDLNDPTIKVAVGLGLGEETLLRARAPKADILAVPVSTDTNAAANVVLAGRADVAIVNLNDAKRFLDANPGKLEALWMDNPPAYMPAGFALRFGDELGASFLNVALRNLKYTGTLSSLARRHGAEADLRGPGGGP